MEYFFPATFLVPAFDDNEIVVCEFRMIRRRWGVSIFDWATLSTKHAVHFPHQLGDVLLGACNCEFVVVANTLDAALARLRLLQLGLAVAGVSPFVCPFACNYSINAYSAINDRESVLLREKLDEERRFGPTAPNDQVEMWPVQLTLSCIRYNAGLECTAGTFAVAATAADRWGTIVASSPHAQTFMDALLAAPLIVPVSQSYLHIWTGIESLFPDVNAELSFRLAILLSQLAETGPQRHTVYRRARDSYALRSKIAHGAAPHIDGEAWGNCWRLACDAAAGVLKRGLLPTEASLMADVFS